jgi:hypothetical protein
MSPGESTTLTDLRLAVARMEERQIAEARSADHHRRNLQMKLDTLASKEHVEAVEDRVGKLEDTQRWASRSIIGAWLAGSGVVAFLAKWKIGGS